MLENRDYMREPSFEPRRPVTTTLLIVNAVVFLLQVISYQVFPAASPRTAPPTDLLFALSLGGLKAGFVWQLLTFQLMHGGILHLILNCWGLYVFGRPVEDALGRRSFLLLYFGSGVFGGLLQMIGALLLPTHLGGAVVGASAGLFGLIAAYATLYPERQLTLLLFFILPVTLRAKYLLLFSALLAVFGIVMPDGQVAHGAHLGGMAIGIFYIRQVIHWQWSGLSFLRRTQRRPPPREVVSVGKGGADVWLRRPKAKPEELPPEEFISQEVDPILDKISQHGIHSLTDRERKILEAARKKMSK